MTTPFKISSVPLRHHVSSTIRTALWLWLCCWALIASSAYADTQATYNSAADIPVTSDSFSPSGTNITFTLNFAPVTGTTLTVVKNTGTNFIPGAFSNLAQGQLVSLPYNGSNYNFVANYYGGSGRDLVLQWASNRPIAWGLNTSGQLGNGFVPISTVPIAVSSIFHEKSVTLLATGLHHSLALCSDGSLLAWGDNTYGQLGNNSTISSSSAVSVQTSGTPLASKTIVALVAGNNHSMALCSDGTVCTWGSNSNGQLGNNSAINSLIPGAINTIGTPLAGKVVTAIAAGAAHSIAYCSDNTLVAWGYNADGELGNGTTTQSLVPTAVTKTSTPLSGRTLSGIAAGQYHNIAICSDGTLATWGYNMDGELGNGLTVRSLIPTTVTTTSPSALLGKTPKAIAAGGFHCLVQCTDGSLLAWGSNGSGQLGINNAAPNAAYANLINTTGTALAGKTVTSFRGGLNHSMALCSDGSIATWGANNTGQLGNNSTTQSLKPVALTIAGTPLVGKSVTMISAGGYHNVVRCSDGSTDAWGDNSDGQLGSPQPTFPVPGPVSTAGTPLAGKILIAEAAGGSHTLALCSDGTLASWGANASGQLGNNSLNPANIPVAVKTSGTPLAGKTVIAVAAGLAHSIALCSDGTIATWGDNTYGQLGNNSTTQSQVPTAVSVTGTALAGETVVAVAAGGNHCLVLCSDGTLVSWGSNSNGQLGNSTFTNSKIPVAVVTSGTPLAGKTVSAMKAAGFHNLVLCSDGTLVAWGGGGGGELGNGSNTTSTVPVGVTMSGVLSGKVVTSIAVGNVHSVALCSDGTVATWGDDTYGQLGNGVLLVPPSTVPSAIVTTGVLAGKTVTAIAAGNHHTMALCADGTAVSWGSNVNGELGGNETYGASFPGPGLINTTGLAAGEQFASLTSGQSASHSLAIIGEPPAPQIYVQQPPGVTLANNLGTIGCGNDPVGVSSQVSITIANSGTAPLTLGTIAIDGANSSDFVVSTPPASVLAAGSSTTMVVTFTPDALFGRNATLHIGSNDPNTATFNVGLTGNGSGNFSAVLSSPTNIPATANGITATGSTINLALDYAPVVGANLTVIKNTGINFISGTFGNLSPGQTVTLRYGGSVYTYLANYYGGSGRDLVLQWKNVRPVAWGSDSNSQLGDNNPVLVPAPIDITSSGALAGKTITALSSNGSNNLALCSDGTLVAWGDNSLGQLGNNSTTSSTVPVQVVTAGTPLDGKAIVTVSVGETHCLAFCSDGTIATWGDNGNGQLGNNSTTLSSIPVAVTTSGTPLAGKTVVAAVAGGYHNLALCSDGTLVSWGWNIEGQLGNNSTSDSHLPVAVSIAGSALAGKTITSMVAGYSHNLVLCSDGTLVAWGSNANGELGINSTNQSNVPAAVTIAGTPLAGKTIVSVTAGFFRSFAVCSDGTLAGWGDNYSGPLGNNTTTNSLVPGAVVTAGTPLAGRTVAAIQTREAHTLAICSDGTLVAWGDNRYGQLGVSGILGTLVPIAVGTTGTALDGKSVTLVSSGDYHNIAYTADGTVAAWGYDVSGQLGNGRPINSAIPTATVTAGTALQGKTIIAEAAGANSSVALCSDGTLAAWGDNENLQLGNNSVGVAVSFPTMIPTAGTPLAGKTIVSVAAGDYHYLALCSDGTVVSWGLNLHGQLGNGSATQTSGPVAVVTTGILSGKTVVAIAAGGMHSLALCSDGTLAAWGSNSTGSLGNNATADSSVPVAVNRNGVLAGKTVVSIAAGGAHSLALCSDGTLVAWGYNFYGQIGNGNNSNSLVPVLVTTAGTPLSGRSIVALAAGEFHSLALCSDGTVATWGYNVDGQLGNNSLATKLVPTAITTVGTPLAGKTISAIAAGQSHSLFLCTDGTLAATGYDADGELGNNAFLNSPAAVAVNTTGLSANEQFSQVAAGQFALHSLALVAAPPGAGVSNNANLSNLTLAAGTLAPSFDPSTTSYSVTVPYTTSSITITPTVADNTATVTVNGVGATSGSPAAPVVLSPGTNTINASVTAQDGQTIKTYSVVVTRLTGLQTWRQTYFGTPNNAGSAADTADDNQTGVPNLLKYAFGLDPVTPGIFAPLPQAMLNGNALTISFTEPSGINGVTYGAQWTSTLNPANWNPVPDTGSGTTHIFSITVGSTPSAFLRLTVSTP